MYDSIYTYVYTFPDPKTGKGEIRAYHTSDVACDAIWNFFKKSPKRNSRGGRKEDLDRINKYKYSKLCNSTECIDEKPETSSDNHSAFLRRMRRKVGRMPEVKQVLIKCYISCKNFILNQLRCGTQTCDRLC